MTTSPSKRLRAVIAAMVLLLAFAIAWFTGKPDPRKERDLARLDDLHSSEPAADPFLDDFQVPPPLDELTPGPTETLVPGENPGNDLTSTSDVASVSGKPALGGVEVQPAAPSAAEGTTPIASSARVAADGTTPPENLHPGNPGMAATPSPRPAHTPPAAVPTEPPLPRPSRTDAETLAASQPPVRDNIPHATDTGPVEDVASIKPRINRADNPDQLQAAATDASRITPSREPAKPAVATTRPQPPPMRNLPLMVEVANAPGTHREAVLKQSKFFVSPAEMSRFLAEFDYAPDATAPDSDIALVSWEQAVGYTAWLTEQQRSTGAIGSDAHYRLPRHGETRSSSIWLHDVRPSSPDERKPFGIVLARGAKP